MLDYYIEQYEERVAIMEYDGNMSRQDAERHARLEIEKTIIKNEKNYVSLITKLKKELWYIK